MDLSHCEGPCGFFDNPPSNRDLQNLTEKMIGGSAGMRQVFLGILQAAPGPTTVLLRGESGVGKELVAEAIHAASPRAKKPFIAVNCAALPENLIESELFGHERGAFTGPMKQRKGRIELAHGGTIFLDEVGELPLGTQTKFLRVLQESTLERVGGDAVLRTDVRVITTTNRPLEDMLEAG